MGLVRRTPGLKHVAGRQWIQRLRSRRHADVRRGRCEGVVEGRLNGWAYDPARPMQRQTVCILLPGRSPITLPADRYRADVQIAGHGDGVSGFMLHVGDLAADQAIRCVWADDGADLPGSPWFAPATSPTTHVTGTILLALDPMARGASSVSGFAVDLSDPGRRLDIALVDRTGASSCARACLYAPSAIAAAPGSDGFHGFHLDLASSGARRAIVDRSTGATLVRLDAR